MRQLQSMTLRFVGQKSHLCINLTLDIKGAKIEKLVKAAGLANFVKGFGKPSVMMQVFLRLYNDALLRLKRLEELTERFRHVQMERQLKVLDAMYLTITKVAPDIMERPEFAELTHGEKSLDRRLARALQKKRRRDSHKDVIPTLAQTASQFMAKTARSLPNLRKTQPSKVDPPTPWFKLPPEEDDVRCSVDDDGFSV